MADLDNDQVRVFHKGDETKSIIGTGKERTMGVLQFEQWGKDNGWAKVPATNKPAEKVEAPKEDPKKANTGTANDPEKTSTGTDNNDDNKATVILSKDDSAVDAIVKIKKLGKSKKLEDIKVYVEGDKRSTIVAAAKKFLNA